MRCQPSLETSVCDQSIVQCMAIGGCTAAGLGLHNYTSCKQVVTVIAGRVLSS